MKLILNTFRQDDSGAVTVDWVVLCAAVVMLAAATITSVQMGADGLAEDTATYISTLEF